MKSKIKSASVILVFMMIFSFPSILNAVTVTTTEPGKPKQVRAIPKLTPEMTQGEFACWLCYAIGAMGPQDMGPDTLSGPLSPAALPKDCVKFLKKKLNVEPKGGWKKDEPATKEFLASFLGYPKDISQEKKQEVDKYLTGPDPESFNKLAEMVENYVAGRFDSRKPAIFRIFGGGTGIYSPGRGTAVAVKPDDSKGSNLHPV